MNCSCQQCIEGERCVSQSLRCIVRIWQTSARGSPRYAGLESLSAFQEARQRANIAVDKIASLTPRQRDVLQGMRRGLLNKQIAWSLDISEKTVKMHRAQVLSKVGCSTTAGAIAIAVEASFAPALS